MPLAALSAVDDHTTACVHITPDLAADAEIADTRTTIAGKKGFTGKAATASGGATLVARIG